MLAQLKAALADLVEAERALDVVALARRHLRGELVLALKLLQVQTVELRLGIERVEMARSAGQRQEDTGPRPRRHVRRPWTQRRFLGLQQRVERRRSECGTQP